MLGAKDDVTTKHLQRNAFDHVVGSDLIFAKEGIIPLVQTYEALCLSSGLIFVCFLICIIQSGLMLHQEL